MRLLSQAFFYHDSTLAWPQPSKNYDIKDIKIQVIGLSYIITTKSAPESQCAIYCPTLASPHLLQGKVRVHFSSLLPVSLSSLSFVSVRRLAIYSQISYNFTEHEDNNLKLSGYDP